MIDNQLELNSIKDNITKAKNILVLLPVNPNVDKVAAALALFLCLKKQAKNVLIACPSKMTVAFNRLFGVNKIQDQIGNRNLIISFDYRKDAIEKVSYNIRENKFNLVVEPQPGKPPLNADQVSYSYSGTESDLIFVIGAQKLEDLDKLYFNEKKTYDQALTINIDYQSNNSRFGKINLLDSQAASCSEITAELIKKLALSLDQDIASNLLWGIEANTSNFQNPRVSASSFEAAAWCLKQGAKKTGFSNYQRFSPQEKPAANSVSVLPSPQPAPADWLKPKIYKGKGLI